MKKTITLRVNGIERCVEIEARTTLLEMVREQLLRKIEDGFTVAVNAARMAKLSREDLIQILDFILGENRDE